MKRTLAIFAAVAVLAAQTVRANDPQTETVRGTVQYSQGWMFFMLDTGGDGVIRVATRQGEPELKPGDVVEATGVPARRNGRFTLEVATYRASGYNTSGPEPQTIVAADLPRVFAAGSPDDLYGKVVTFQARVTGVHIQDWGFSEVSLDFGGRHVFANMQGRLPADLLEDLQLQPEVRVTGCLILDDINLPPGETPEIELRLYSPRSIAIVPDVVFRRRKMLRGAANLFRFSPFVLAAAVAALSFKLYKSRQTKDRLQAVIAERRRMAADLHDSIEQHLAGARLYLDSMLPADGSPAPAPLKPVELARDILVSVKREIRETVWNLRIEELADKRPADVLASLAGRISSTGAVHVDTRLSGLPESLPEGIFADLLYIVQEAVTNAVKHGGATRVVIASQPAPAGGKGFALSIANNGASFDTAHALGPETGHFGLSGMRERARRCGFAISIASRRRVTAIRLEASL